MCSYIERQTHSALAQRKQIELPVRTFVSGSSCYDAKTDIIRRAIAANLIDLLYRVTYSVLTT